jgi:uncharacterized membrane protein YdjX (TVP38/TMEM64 family)
VAVAAGLGAALGELSGYLAGFSGQGIAERISQYRKLTAWMKDHQKYTYALIALMAFVPNPLFDLAGMAAGALRLPIWKFLLASSLGKILKMLFFAFAGFYSIGWLTDWFVR